MKRLFLLFLMAGCAVAPLADDDDDATPAPNAEVEPNDTQASAHHLGAFGSYEINGICGNAETATDPDPEDWFRFDSGAGLIQLDLAFAWPEPADVDITHASNLWIVSATGLGFFNFRWNDPPISETHNAFTPTTFYVSVKNVAGACPTVVDSTGASVDLPLPYTITVVVP